ncbi:MAG TPA: Sec-independent protein translocase subunit TatA [Streptosporangiaceae bacterium]|jgi:sec-independent protein translocase protein TatA|nr:Sec-independent protein translocase subunit TatA [Streptosporangiaceae bacterium]
MLGDLFDSPWKILIIAVVVLVLFGSKKLPDAARSLGKSMRILKTEIHELHDDDEATTATTATTAPAATVSPAITAPAQAPVPQQQVDALQQQLDELRRQQTVASDAQQTQVS